MAKEAEFFSFGTNDLTQTTMGLSRDDYTRFQGDYEKERSSRPIPSPCSIRKAWASWSRWREARTRRAQGSRSRHLRRARRRAEFGAVLLPDRDGLCVLLALSCADRETRGGAGRA
jgi:hypothetical protein